MSENELRIQTAERLRPLRGTMTEAKFAKLVKDVSHITATCALWMEQREADSHPIMPAFEYGNHLTLLPT